MAGKYQRKEFLKMAALANMGLFLKPWNLSAGPSEIEESAQAQDFLSTENVSFYQKGQQEYYKLRRGFNKRINKYPMVIALCRNVSGITEAIQYAREKNLPVAIKSGGHSMEGFSNSQGGMVINLSLLNTFEWIDENTIKVGPACTLSKLYSETLKKGKILPGGSCGTVGIGGLTLGGGYGFFSRKFGLTCDSLKEISMIDGNGILRNSSTDQDLLWACKGGGNGNFGVIYEMIFNVHPAPEYLKSHRFKAFNVDTRKARALLKNWFVVTSRLPLNCFSTYILNGSTVYMLLTNIGEDDSEVAVIIQQLSKNMDKVTKSSNIRVESAVKIFYGIPRPLYFKNASVGLYKNFADIDNYIHQILEIVGKSPGMIYQVNTLGGAIQSEAMESLSSFPHRAFSYFSELQTYWENHAEAAPLLAAFKKIQEISVGKSTGAEYCNYPDINFKNWETQYYGVNYPRLQQLKNKYDPDNRIRHEQSVRNAPK